MAQKKVSGQKILGIGQCIYRGNRYVKALVNKIDNPFWNCVANTILEIQNKFKPKTMTDLMGLPICSFNNLNHKSWVDEGVYLIGDVVSENTEVLTLNEFIKIYGIQTNFLEYGAIKVSIITRYLKDTKSVGNIYTKEVGPLNTFLNTIINLDVKGVSKLYKIGNSGKTNIITDIATKWKNKTGEDFTNYEIVQGFIINQISTCKLNIYNTGFYITEWLQNMDYSKWT